MAENKPKTGKVEVGQVWRMNGHGVYVDQTIVSLNGYGLAKVARPFVYASANVGTPLCGMEVYEIPAQHIWDHWDYRGQGYTVS